MGVAHEAWGALDLTLQLADAPEEEEVELTLLAQLLGLMRECSLGAGEFFRERGDDGLWLTNGLRFQLLKAVGEAMNETDDSVNALRVNPEDVGRAEKVHPL